MISQEIVRPSDCTLAVCLPTSRERFMKARADVENRDFVLHHCATWEKYNHYVMSHLSIVLPELIRMGVCVQLDVTHCDFSRLLSSARSRVIILFAHYVEGAAEFADGLHSDEAVTLAVPCEFDGLLDLCVCHPKLLVQRLRDERPRCLVKFTNRPARTSFWIHLYRVLFAILEGEAIAPGQRPTGGVPYLLALERAVAAMLPSRQSQEGLLE
jgi:hypothetical protein